MSEILQDPSGKPVIILSGKFAGQEGVCLGPDTTPGAFAVSPTGSSAILTLVLGREFGILLNKGQLQGIN
jgi:hypothetical protein